MVTFEEVTIVSLLVAAVAAFTAATANFQAAGQGTSALMSGGLLSIASALLLIYGTTPAPEPPPTGVDYGGIRPHLQGDGSTTPGGRFGHLCRITNRNTGTATWNDGSFKGCVVALPPGCTGRTGSQSACARTVISDVSGALDFSNQTLVVTGPYLSVWGSTAPSCSEGSGSGDCSAGAGGLTLQNVQLMIDTHDVYLNHLRIRRGPQSLNPLLTCSFTAGYDCGPVNHHVFEHLSVAWADMPNDGATGVNNVNGAQPSNSSSILVDSIISEPLWDPPWGGLGAAFCGVFARNLIAHAFDRGPIWSGGRCALFNNVTYNGSEDLSGQALISATTLYDPARLGRIETVFRDNAYLTGPDSGAVNWTLGFYVEKAMLTYGGGAYVYMAGNTGPGITGPTGDGQWTATQPKQYDTRPNAATGGVSSNLRTNTEPEWFMRHQFDVKVNTGTTVRDYVLQHAGARPTDRDAADARVVGDVTERDGTSYLNWAAVQSRYGGQPTIVQRTRVCQPPSDPHGPGTRTLADGSTNTRLEDWLESDPACGAQRLERRAETRRTRR